MPIKLLAALICSVVATGSEPYVTCSPLHSDVAPGETDISATRRMTIRTLLDAGLGKEAVLG
jgi:hypothetical protein